MSWELVHGIEPGTSRHSMSGLYDSMSWKYDGYLMCKLYDLMN